jgi:2,3-bisphosphoglycerate-dependent phosphoglycerate mutase
MTLYLIRHAQCLPKKAQRFPDWSLSRVGARQAEELAGLLEPLEIANVFSSPFIRTIDTAKPFAQRHGLVIRVVDDLRERLLTNAPGLPSDEVWRRSWEDFSFCLPGCESSLAAQARICRAIGGIAESVEGTSAIFTHGNVIPLFLNALTRSVGRTEPDVLKVSWRSGAFAWDRAFRLPGLARIATDHRQTPVEQDTPAPNSQGGANPDSESGFGSETNRTSAAAGSRRSS